MAIRVFSLQGVSSEEADAIRELLTKNKIKFYETPAGDWGLSMAAIWLKNEQQLPLAKALIEAYQRKYFHSAHKGNKKKRSLRKKDCLKR